jgi:predicted ribosomally synthesized peptide with nif11-like leader
MSIHNARRFVEKLRDDHDFRKKTLATSGPEDLSAFLYAEGLAFDQRELVGAMAECMQQLESLRSV